MHNFLSNSLLKATSWLSGLRDDSENRSIWIVVAPHDDAVTTMKSRRWTELYGVLKGFSTRTPFISSAGLRSSLHNVSHQPAGGDYD